MELAGKILGCWCKAKPTNPCHGDVLASIADGVVTPTLQGLLAARKSVTIIPRSMASSFASSSLKENESSRVMTEGPSPRVLLDRVRGGFFGLALGDALGVPHEVTRFNKGLYTGHLYLRARHHSRFHGMRTMGVGQNSDDTEMAIVLAQALVEGQGWKEEVVIRHYLEWANSGTPWMGKQTRALFTGITTHSGFTRRYVKMTTMDPAAMRTLLITDVASPAEQYQSNGSLMRCFPLACVWNAEVGGSDAALTNPSSVNHAIGIYYTGLLRLALTGAPAAEVWEKAVATAFHPEIVRVVAAVSEGEAWTLADTPRIKAKGWVVNALYAGMYCLRAMVVQPELTFGDLMRWVIHDHPGSDTDTNAAIAGCLIGSMMGWDALLEQEKVNIDIMLSESETDMPRPSRYQPSQIETLCQKLTQLSGVVICD